MKSIKDEVGFFQDISSSKQKSLDELCSSPKIAAFMEMYGYSRIDMDPYWLELLNYRDDYTLCQQCHSIQECPKKLVGYKRKLAVNEDRVTIVMEPCSFEKELEKTNSILSNIQTNLPKKLFNENFMQIKDTNPLLFMEYLQFATNLSDQSIYLYGPTQTGKTKMMAYFAYYLASNGKKVAMYNVPNLMSLLKSSFNDDDIDSGDVLNRLKRADILILDDLGGENFSTWSRDEVIATIIEERALASLPTFYTSVYSYNDLADYYTTKQKGDSIKVAKLIEKIKANTKPIQA